MAPELGRAVDVGGGLEILRGLPGSRCERVGVRGLAGEGGLGVGGADGPVRDSHQGEPRLVDAFPVEGDHGRDADEGEVAVAAGDLVERPPAARRSRRDPDLCQQLVVGDRRGEVPDEELVRRHDSVGLGGAHHHLGAGGDSDRGDLGRRVGVGDGAADGASVADRHVADEWQRLGQHR